MATEKYQNCNVLAHHCRLRLIAMEPLRISTRTLLKVEFLGYICAAVGPYGFIFFVLGSERCMICIAKYVMTVQGHPGSSRLLSEVIHCET